MVATSQEPLPRHLSWLLALILLALGGCVVDEMGLTEPCQAGCNGEAVLGSTCTQAQDCGLGMLCNLTFPGGYCQLGCEELGAACGASQEGLCLANPGGDPVGLCLGRCDPSAPGSCPNPQSSCYPQPDGSTGLCGLRCGAHSDCGGLACDGQGVCRAAQQCNTLTDGACLEQGQRCYLSGHLGTWCGLPGSVDLSQPCTLEAECAQGTWCIQGACRARCDTDDFTACGGVPALCTPLVVGNRLGFCVP